MYCLYRIEDTLAVPFRKRSLRQVEDPPAGTANPIYEIEDFLRDRIVLDKSRCEQYDCENLECSRAYTEDEDIFRFQYFCIDCAPGQNPFFCSDCLVLSGQGMEHDPTHRLLRLLPTTCAVCQDVTPLEEHPGGAFQGPYREFSASGATLRRVADARACPFCAFVWSALRQHPLDDIQWPPDEDQEVTIRIKTPRAAWLGIAVVSDRGVKERKVELDGQRYTIRQQDAFDKERELLVGLPIGMFGPIGIESSHHRLIVFSRVVSSDACQSPHLRPTALSAKQHC